jgi:hypothetical protein
MFKSLFKSVAPLIRPVASRVLHTLKNEGVKHGMSAVQDLMSGTHPKHVLKTHGLELGKQLLGSIKGTSSHTPRHSEFGHQADQLNQEGRGRLLTKKRKAKKRPASHLNQKGRGRLLSKKRKAKRKTTHCSKRRRLDIFD